MKQLYKKIIRPFSASRNLVSPGLSWEAGYLAQKFCSQHKEYPEAAVLKAVQAVLQQPLDPRPGDSLLAAVRERLEKGGA